MAGRGWKNRQGVNHWGWYLTLDEQREILYTSFGSPAGNYWGGDRPGSNLYANSVVAVDVNTGKYLWHFQTVHHDLWDSDQPSPPTLVDITRNGRRVPALGLIGKTAWMFMLDRTTRQAGVRRRGTPGPERRRARRMVLADAAVPGEAAALARIDFKKEDLVTADRHDAGAREELSGAVREGGRVLQRRPVHAVPLPRGGHASGRARFSFPAMAERTGAVLRAILARLHLRVHPDAALSGWVEKKREDGNYGSGNGSPQPHDRGSINGPGPHPGLRLDGAGPSRGACQKPPWGRLTAVDANTGEFAWQITLGITDGLPPEKQNTGRGGSAGPIVTAGGWCSSAPRVMRGSGNRFEDRQGTFVTRLNATGTASPITYSGAGTGSSMWCRRPRGMLNVFSLP